MKPIIIPEDQVFWYLPKDEVQPLRASIATEVVVVGGGMAGLSAAQSFNEAGLHVVLLEKNFCGSGASGKSSGFITPDSEISLSELSECYGESGSQALWDFVNGGAQIIKNNIMHFGLACDQQQQDSLVVANSAAAFKRNIEPEYATRQELKYPSKLYSASELPTILASDGYYGGVSYGNTFGIKVYDYCQEMKKVLQKKGVQVYEETPVLQVSAHEVVTPYARVQAKYIVVCTDRFLPALNKLSADVYQIQNALMLSSPLTPEQVQHIFPRQRYMVWDTDLVYQYFRLTGDNRLMLGGANLWNMYSPHIRHDNTSMTRKLTKYCDAKFPKAKVSFEYIWPGMIGISKDFLPIAGKDKDTPSLYYVSAAAGLPWAAALGAYSAHSLLQNDARMDAYFSPYRNYRLGRVTQAILGKRITFALSHFLRTSRL